MLADLARNSSHGYSHESLGTGLSSGMVQRGCVTREMMAGCKGQDRGSLLEEVFPPVVGHGGTKTKQKMGTGCWK